MDPNSPEAVAVWCVSSGVMGRLLEVLVNDDSAAKVGKLFHLVCGVSPPATK